MQLTLDTYFMPKRIKNAYYFDDKIKAIANFRKSGTLASVEIKGVSYNSLHEDFQYFKNMVLQAKRNLDDDCLVAISALRGQS